MNVRWGDTIALLTGDFIFAKVLHLAIAVDVGVKLEDLPRLLEAEKRRLPLTQIPLIIETLHRTVGIMENRINAQKLAEARPEVLIGPALNDGFSLFAGFNRAAECIAAGEKAATAALPEIRKALKRRFWRC